MNTNTPSHASPLSVQALPQELVDNIIDHLWDDLPSLQTCSLTCRSWVESAQYHIFHHVEAQITIGDPFWALLESSPHIAQYVKTLAIYQRPNSPAMHSPPDGIDTVVQRLLPLAANILWRVEDLRISHISISPLAAKAHATVFRTCLSMRTLTISNATFRRFEDIIRMIITNPQVEILENFRSIVHGY
ncbi:hypothetical protein K439DRAFT_318939 [Ramaria rubella]|nr:hypothetical protein K439DRAFT_318939 [Ramaria rubella]